MTDKEKLKALLTEFGIGFTEPVAEECQNNIMGIVIEKGNVEEGHEKVTGYYGFSAEFEFDAEGKFIQVGVWE
jgi:hypothetical protein